MIVAFEQVQGPQSRMLAEMASGVPFSTEYRRHPPGLGRYWCAADRPEEDEYDFRVRAVYRTATVPEDARCEHCGIQIRDLQEEMSRW